MTPVSDLLDLQARWADRLRAALAQRGESLEPQAALEMVAVLQSQLDQPLDSLDALLKAQKIMLEPDALNSLAWMLLGASSSVPSRDWTRLTAIAELHDVSRPGEIAPLLRLLSDEAWLAPDLRRARPWLESEASPEAVLNDVFEQEWSGFVTHLGTFGPWVYAAGVAGVQTLAHAHAALVKLALTHANTDLLAAAFQQARDCPGHLSLLARLHPAVPPAKPGLQADVRASAALIQAEQHFWHVAQSQAQQRRDDWAARRRGQRLF